MAATPAGAFYRDPSSISHLYKNHAGVFARLFSEIRDAPREWVQKLFREVTIDGAFEVDQTWGATSIPTPLYVGEEIEDDGLREYTIKMIPHQYKTNRIAARFRDIRDSKAPESIEAKMREPANFLARHEDFVWPELFAGSPSQYLHKEASQDNIFGGTGFFSNSHSYNGYTFDNKVTRTINNANDLINALYDAHSVFDETTSDNGDEYWNPQRRNGAQLLVVTSTAMRQTVDQATKSELIALGGNQTAQTNYWANIFNSSSSEFVGSQKITDDKLYVFMVAANDSDRIDLAPFVKGVKQGVETEEWRRENSDEAKRGQFNAIRFIAEHYYGPGNILAGCVIEPAA